jgi:DNA phosphorothioation-associated putative methyltransferase
LPAVLRLYVGCATQLYGDVDKADLVKIHIQSGKVSLMRYDDFVNKPLPQLLERIKIKLREQQIDFFDYTTQPKIQLLYLKTRFIPPDFPFYNEQQTFDQQLQSLTQFDFAGFGPPPEKLLEAIEQSNLGISFQMPVK